MSHNTEEQFWNEYLKGFTLIFNVWLHTKVALKNELFLNNNANWLF